VKILFDQGTPAPLRRELPKHTITTAFEKGWATLTNGDLLAKAEHEFDLLITTDQNLQYQQNLAGRRIAILVLPTTSWPKIQSHTAEIAAAADRMKPGDYVALVW
jgi:predicted nuclease of predicted toxin-antitoxin system